MKAKPNEAKAVPSAVELIEEAVHLLRRAPAGALAVYYAGSAPFALGLTFFWARTTWFRPSGAAIAWGALGLVVLFGAMKAAQADFCARLLALRLGEASRPRSWRRWRRLALAQLRVQAWGIPALPAALLAAVPFGWVYAYFQSASVLGDEEPLGALARRQARLWPGQNHLGQLLLSVLGIAVWLNIAISFWLVPWLANRLLGIENLFGFSGWWYLNTTFLALVTVLTWLLVDPLVKAFFTLRVFHGRAWRTGEDLRVELRWAGSGLRGRVAAAVITAAAALAGLRGPTVRAEDHPNAVSPAKLNAAIDRVLAGEDFQWRLRPLPRVATRASDEGNAFQRFAREVVDSVRAFFHWLGKSWQRLTDWFDRLFPGRETAGGAASPAHTGMDSLRIVLWVFVVAVVGLLVSAIVLAWRRSRGYRRPAVQAHAVRAAAAPDLSDESTQAAQLPADEWLALARKQLALGEWRLAWRALHLAMLAQLAREGFVTLAKFKTNLDYERELRRRAVTRLDRVAAFSARSRAFEAVWYGRAPAVETEARTWLAELERPAPR